MVVIPDDVVSFFMFMVGKYRRNLLSWLTVMVWLIIVRDRPIGIFILHTAGITKNNILLVASIFMAIAYGWFFPGPNDFIRFGVDFIILIHQIPVIPYVFISILVGIGSLNVQSAGRVIKRLMTILSIIWLFSIVFLFFLAYVFSQAAGSGAHDALNSLMYPVGIDMPEIAVSSSFIPAVIFLIATAGFGLMQLPDKDQLLKPLRVISEVIEYIFDCLLVMLPFSLFFLLAHAVSVMTLQTFQQTSVYLMASSIFCLFFIFWLYPWGLKVFANMPFQRIQHEIFPCLWLSFLAGDCAVALPLMLTALRHLLKDIIREEHSMLIGVLIPIAFAVPMAGSIGNLIFLFFTSLMYNIPMQWSHYFLIAFMGPVTMFSEPIISIPSMLTLLSLPKESLPLYMLAGVITDPIFDAAEAFSILFICYMVVYSMEYKICISWHKISVFLIPTTAIASLLLLLMYIITILMQ